MSVAAAAAPPLPGSARPLLPRGVRLKFCAVRQCWFLLAPERALKLDQTGVAVLQAVDGARDFDAITAHLAQAFSAPRDRIAADAGRFLAALIARRMVETA